jgi:hypothetical protein
VANSRLRPLLALLSNVIFRLSTINSYASDSIFLVNLPLRRSLLPHEDNCINIPIWAVESESVKMYQLRLRPQSKILITYSKFRALIATITIRLKICYKSKNQPDDSRSGDEMSYWFTVINTYWDFKEESESEFWKLRSWSRSRKFCVPTPQPWYRCRLTDEHLKYCIHLCLINCNPPFSELSQDNIVSCINFATGRLMKTPF